MKAPNTMTDPQLVKWMDKTIRSISAAALRGQTSQNANSWSLNDRHYDLKSEMLKRDQLWYDYCNDRGYAYAHDAYDCWA